MIYYICSPYRGKTSEQQAEHIQYAKDLAREQLLYGICPIVPHLYITECLDDSNSIERKIGLEAALELLEKCDAVVVGQFYGISEGMKAEIKQAKKLGKPIFYRDHIHKDRGLI